uniref:Uncharacterized protein n=1 Tax=Rhizophora mucronata TaxID=61149 RepID=A0A2P2QSH5_RHIMU
MYVYSFPNPMRLQEVKAMPKSNWLFIPAMQPLISPLI